jgi:DNA-binding response OmpR family regulator
MSIEILWVEDDCRLHDMYTAIFLENDITIRWATSVAGAIQALRQSSFDVLVSDLCLPRGDLSRLNVPGGEEFERCSGGRALVRLIRKGWVSTDSHVRDIHILIVTAALGECDWSVVESLIDDGVDDMEGKPCATEVLLGRIKTFVRLRELTRRLAATISELERLDTLERSDVR